MRPPPRLVDGADVRAQLLRAARDDAPGGRSRQRVSAAIALAVGSLASRSTAALAAATVTRSVLLKTLLGAGLVTLLAVGGQDARVAMLRSAEHPAMFRSSKPPAAPRPVLLPAPSPAPAPVPTPVPTSTSAATSTVAPARTAGTLADEVALLGEAKRALDAGRTDAAFAAVTAYERRFPRGALAQEAAALRVETTARSGDPERAASLARAFEASYPGSPLRGTVRSAAGVP